MRIVFILLLLPSLVLAQEADVSPADDPTDTTAATDTATVASESATLTEAEADTEAQSTTQAAENDTFVPTTRIIEDFSVAFPTDI